MLVILEGLEGTGKTVAAQAISRSLGLPIYRAFRSDPLERYGAHNHIEAALRLLNVPVNTYIDDLYTADLLATIGGDVILDRSMPSGYAYGLWETLLDDSQAREALDYWLWRLSSRSDVHYIDLTCTRSMAEARSPGHQHRSDDMHETLRLHLDECYKASAQRFHATKIDTTHGGVGAMLGAISKHLGKEVRQ